MDEATQAPARPSLAHRLLLLPLALLAVGRWLLHLLHQRAQVDAGAEVTTLACRHSGAGRESGFQEEPVKYGQLPNCPTYVGTGCTPPTHLGDGSPYAGLGVVPHRPSEYRPYVPYRAQFMGNPSQHTCCKLSVLESLERIGV